MYFDTIPPGTSDVEVWFTYTPADVTAVGNTILTPPEWQVAIKAYAEYRVRTMDREDGLADRARAEYDALKASAAIVNEAVLHTGGMMQ